jgi:hypothetical protein
LIGVVGAGGDKDDLPGGGKGKSVLEIGKCICPRGTIVGSCGGGAHKVEALLLIGSDIRRALTLARVSGHIMV